MQYDATAAPLCNVSAGTSHERLAKVVAADGTAWCVLRDGDDWLATEAVCPHRGRDLSVCGIVEDGVLTCLGHLWQWNLRKGGTPIGAADRPLRVVRLALRGEALHLPSW